MGNYISLRVFNQVFLKGWGTLYLRKHVNSLPLLIRGFFFIPITALRLRASIAHYVRLERPLQALL